MMMGQDMGRHQFSVSMSAVGHPANKAFDRFADDYCRAHGLDADKQHTPLFPTRKHVMVSLHYDYRLTERLSVGLTGGWAVAQSNYHDYVVDETLFWFIPVKTHTTADLRMKSRVLYVGPTARYEWFRSRNGVIGAYSGLSVGVVKRTFKAGWRVPDATPDECHTKWRLGYQLTPLGLELGGEHLRFFGEVGYGQQCVATFGLRVLL